MLSEKPHGSRYPNSLCMGTKEIGLDTLHVRIIQNLLKISCPTVIMERFLDVLAEFPRRSRWTDASARPVVAAVGREESPVLALALVPAVGAARCQQETKWRFKNRKLRAK